MANVEKIRFRDILKNESFLFHIEYGKLNSDYKNHTHDFNELFIVTKGTAVHKIHENIQTISAGDVFVIRRPDIEHCFMEPVQLELYNIMYTDGFAGEPGDELMQMEGYQSLFVLEPIFAGKNSYRNFQKLSFANLEEVVCIVERIYEEYTYQKSGYQSIVKSGFVELMVKLSRFYEFSDTNRNYSKSRNLGKVIAYVEKNFQKPLMVKELASMASLSERQFLRVFKDCFNMTPVQYINRLRISHAIRLLKNTEYSIKEVALSSGFSDANYFTRRFIASEGISPGQFRVKRK